MQFIKIKEIPHGWVLLILVNKLRNVFGIGPVLGGVGVVLSGGGTLLYKKISLSLFDVEHYFRGDIPLSSL